MQVFFYFFAFFWLLTIFYRYISTTVTTIQTHPQPRHDLAPPLSLQWRTAAKIAATSHIVWLPPPPWTSHYKHTYCHITHNHHICQSPQPLWTAAMTVPNDDSRAETTTRKGAWDTYASQAPGIFLSFFISLLMFYLQKTTSTAAYSTTTANSTTSKQEKSKKIMSTFLEPWGTTREQTTQEMSYNISLAFCMSFYIFFISFLLY